jgi:hypothetical protein
MTVPGLFEAPKMEVLMGKPWENHRKMEVYPLVI